MLKIVDAATLNGTFTNLAQGAAIAGGLLLDYHTATGDVNLLKNSPPIGVNDAASATEAGGVANGTAGIDPSGNVLLNDTDAENNPLAVTAVRVGAWQAAVRPERLALRWSASTAASPCRPAEHLSTSSTIMIRPSMHSMLPAR